MVPTLVGDINEQKEKHADANFAFCVHVGTSASENIKTSRPGFMEGRVKTLVDALADQGLEVNSANAFEHFKSTRFAGLVMKVYTGEEAPGCNQDDLIPPPAGSLLQVAVHEDPAEEDVGTFPAEEPAAEEEEEEEDVGTYMASDEGADVEMEEGTDAAEAIFTVAAGEEEQQANPDSDVQKLVEIRTTLKFKGNKVALRNPQMVPTLLEDINGQKEKYPNANFAFCVHVGTSAGEKIKTARPGFMEGRVKSLVDALAEQGVEIDSDNAFEHYQSTRFAGLVMKVYNGETAPQCRKEELNPPSA